MCTTHVANRPLPPLSFLHMGWIQLVGSLKLQVSFAEFSLFDRALLQKRPVILRSLLIVPTPYSTCLYHTIPPYNTSARVQVCYSVLQCAAVCCSLCHTTPVQECRQAGLHAHQVMHAPPGSIRREYTSGWHRCTCS